MRIAAVTGVLHSFLLPRVNLSQLQLHAVALRKAFASNAPQQDNEEMREARKWLSSFTPDSIPKQFWVLSFARSSGPGKLRYVPTYLYLLGGGIKMVSLIGAYN